MKRFLLIAAILFSLVLALPLFQMATGWPPDHPLQGVETTAALPGVSLSGWWHGRVQADFDAWLNQSIGLRGVWVRTANQIHYSLFRELPKRRGTQVWMGRDGFLFEKVYVDAYNRGFNKEGFRTDTELQSISASVRRLQNRLAADGIAFLLVLAPSKAEIYPEYLPEKADVAGRPERRSTYERMVPFLREAGVQLLDAHELFLEWKREPGTPWLFNKGGTHWNQYGAARMVAQLLARLGDLTGKDLPRLEISGAVTNRTILDSDNDLAELVNLWSGRTLAGPQIHPVVEVRPGTHLPDLLFIGDSFVFTLTNFMDRHALYRQRDTYYYYKSQYSFPEAPIATLDKRSLDLLAEIEGRDAVVVEINEYWLPKIGFGFVRDLLRAYDAQDAQPPAGTPAS